MTDQVIFNVDRALKKRAMIRAGKEGIPLSSVLKLAVKAYVEGEIDVGLVENFNKKTLKRYLKAEADLAKGINISPKFSTVAQARAYLDN